MRQLFIGMVSYGAVGAVLASHGLNFTAWEFWSIMVSMSIMQANYMND